MNKPLIQVGVLNDEEIKFKLSQEYTVNDTGRKIQGDCIARVNDHNKVIVECNGIEIFRGAECSLNPIDENVPFTIHDVIIGVKFHWERREDQQFPGSLRIVREHGKLTAVNILPVEEYLQSVISSEMSAMSNMNLLKAHAVISRGWLLAQIDKSKKLKEASQSYTSSIEKDDEVIRWYDREDHTLYDVCADDHCQRYQGITKAYTESAKRAVQETSGMVLMHEGEICDARYSKACGGLTENFENVWEPKEHAYLISIIDNAEKPQGYDLDLTKEENAERWIRESPSAFCNTADNEILSQVLMDFDQETTDFYRWKMSYSQKELSDLIAEKSGIDFGDIRDLLPVERGYSGRLIKLKIVGTKKTMTIGKELEIRRTLSPSHLYSSAFVVDKNNDVNGIPREFTLTGAGWGHGVGLCQIGAAVMGARGYTYEEILKHYFKDAKLEGLY